jgi:ABC-type siderophore export system fused ATPase/permease subunit
MKPLIEFLSQDRPAAIRVALWTLVAAISERLALLAALSAVMDRDGSPLARTGIAAGTCAASLVFLVTFRAASSHGLVLGEEACDRLLLRLAGHIRRAELRDTEHLGGEQLLARLSRDTSTLLEASRSSILLLFLMCSMVVPAIYIFTESFYSALLLMAIGIVALPALRAFHAAQVHNEQSAAAADARFLRLADQVISGFLWLKLDRRRRADLCDNYLWPSIHTAQASNVTAGKAYERTKPP